MIRSRESRRIKPGEYLLRRRLTLQLHATRAAARYFESYTSARSPRA
jgi:hypothetical protein